MRLVDHASLWALALLGAILCGCFAGFEVECGADAHCNRYPGGLCHTNPGTERRWCGYPDQACPSGYRYSDLDVGDGVSGTCTGEPPLGPIGRCNPAAEFQAPIPVPQLSSLLSERSLSMTGDELLLLLLRGISDGTPLTSMRSSISDEFPPPSVDPRFDPIVAAPGYEDQAWLSRDGLLVYFKRVIAGADKFFVATREALNDSFDTGRELLVGGMLIPPSPLIQDLHLSANGATLYWTGPDGMLHSARGSGLISSFSAESHASTVIMFQPRVSADELTVYYSDGNDVSKIYRATRTSKDIPFGQGVSILSLDNGAGGWNIVTAVSMDHCLLYLTRTEPGKGDLDIWVASRPR